MSFWTWLNQMLIFWWQRQTRGWDDSETWDLNVQISKFCIPRLKRLRQMDASFPCNVNSMEEWQAILDDMIYAHEYVVLSHHYHREYFDLDVERYARGMEYFFDYYHDLNW